MEIKILQDYFKGIDNNIIISGLKQMDYRKEEIF